jgi:endo-1,4-beta-xylanase
MSIISALLLAGASVSWSQTGPTLQSLAAKLNLTMGAGASDPEQLKDSKYAAIASTQYGALEPGNSMKMYALEPSQGQYSFSSADTVAALLKLMACM